MLVFCLLSRDVHYKSIAFFNSLCAVGIADNTFNLKRTKTIDMRYHWIRDQVKLQVFRITWKAGKFNLADFFTKAHPVKHNLDIRWKCVLIWRIIVI